MSFIQIFFSSEAIPGFKWYVIQLETEEYIFLSSEIKINIASRRQYS